MLDPSLEEQELLADTFQRDHAGLTRSELIAAGLDTAGFIVITLLLVLVRPPQDFSLLATLAASAVLVLASRVQFDTPFGFTVPVQLGFVPLLFSAPVALVPVIVAAALAAARLPE